MVVDVQGLIGDNSLTLYIFLSDLARKEEVGLIED